MRGKLVSKEFSGFARDSVMLMLATNIAGLLYMLVHSVVGRGLGGVEYAVLVSMLGLLNVLNVPASAVNVVMARYVAEHAHGDAVAVWVTIVKRALRRITGLGIVAFILWSLFSPVVRNFLNAPSAGVLIIVGMIAFVSLYVPVTQGVLQGGRLFGWMSLVSFLTAFMRLGFVWGAVRLYGTVDFVLWAVFVSSVAGLLISYVPFRGVMKNTAELTDFDTAPIYRYLWPVLAGQCAMFLLTNVDIILATRFLAGDELEAYGKAAMLSRCVFMVSLPVALAMFPRAVVSGEKFLVLGPMVFALVVSLGVALVVSFFPQLPMLVMYGVDAQLSLDLMKVYVWAILPVAMLQVGVPYLWARDRQKSVVFLLPVVALYILCLLFRHDNAYEMISCLAVGGWLTFIVMGFFVYRALSKGD